MVAYVFRVINCHAGLVELRDAPCAVLIVIVISLTAIVGVGVLRLRLRDN